MRLILTILISFSLSSWSFSAEENQTPDGSGNTRITSHLKNVVVVGMPKEIALDVAIWAETVIEKIQDWSGSTIPGNYVYPIVIRAEERENESQGFVGATQYVTDDGHVRQLLTIVNRTRVDREDLLEGLCHHLLNRWVHVRQTREGLSRQPEQFPHWLTYGVAQSLFSDLMSRNFSVIEAAERKGQYKPASSIVTQLILPPGRVPEKARSGLVMKWFSTEVSPSGFLPEAASLVANNEFIDEAFLVKQLGADSTAVFNKNWDLWMAQQKRRIVPGVMALDIEKLSRVLEMRADDLGVAHPAVRGKQKVPVGLLIEERKMSWARDVSKIMGWKLRFESIAKTRDVQEHIAPFLEFFELMLRRPKELPNISNKLRKNTIKPPSARFLRKKWRKADEAWRKFVDTLSAREAFLDAYEQPGAVQDADVRDWLNQWQEKNL